MTTHSITKAIAGFMTAIMLITPATSFAATPAISGIFVVVSSTTTPAAQTVSVAQPNVNAFAFELYARADEGMKVKQLSLGVTGLFSNSDIQNIRLVDTKTNQQLGNTIAQAANTLTFSSVNLQLAKGEKRTLKVIVDIASNATVGNNFRFKVTNSSAIGSITGNTYTAQFKPAVVEGNTVTIANLSQLIIQKSAFQPSTSPMAPGIDRPFFKFVMTAGGTDVMVKKMTYNYYNTNPATVTKMMLKDKNGNVITSFFPIPGTNTISFSTYVLIPKGTTLEFTMTADMPQSFANQNNVFVFTVKSVEATDMTSGSKFASTGEATSNTVVLQ